MIRSPDELTKPIESAVNRKAVLFSHIALAAIAVIHAFLTINSTTFVRIAALIFGIVVVILALLRVFDLANINKRPQATIITYYVITFFGYVFITDPATPYTVAIFLVLFLTNLYYGARGVKFAIGFFAVASLAKYIYMSATYLQSTVGLTYNDKLNIIVAFLVFAAIASMFMNIQTVFDWDRAKLRETIKESVVEQKRLRALINNMTESVLVLDKEGIIRLYNAAALALFNTNTSLSDKPLDGFIRMEDEKGKIITTVDLLPKTTKPIVRSDILLRYSKDDTASISIVATPIRSTFGQERDEEGYVITMRDITREKSLEEERDEFISVISHELRTPVTVAEAGVSNALLLSQKSPGNEKITKSLQTAHDQAVFLANMLNDLTTFARAEKGTLEMNLEEFDPRELLETLCNDYKGAVTSKGMFIKTSIDPSTPLLMSSNRLYIREILQNFLTNAIKYSDKGTITLMTRAKDQGILYSVADEGIGISVSDQKKIFEKFFRTEDYRTRSTNGTGLGLYIVKKLAKILDASFEVQSEVGKGSMFSVYVPDMGDKLAAKKAADAIPVSTTHQAPIQPAAPATTNTPAVVPVAATASAPQALTAAPLPAPQPPAPAPPTNPTLPKQG